MSDKKGYLPPQKSNWIGRASSVENPSQYWHEVVSLIDLNVYEGNEGIPDVILIGYACDEGVRRNLGRVGAARGPKTIRERLGKLAVHFTDMVVADVGDVVCDQEDMETCQKNLAEMVAFLIDRGSFPVILGGGHDVAFGTFNGVKQSVKGKNKSIGIINFDAHFDLRRVESQSNSGTPFYQILSEARQTGNMVNYCAIGIQSQSNTRSLYETAEEYDVLFIPIEDCETDVDSIKKIENQLKTFANHCDVLYITIDLDGFSSAYAPGVSAPSPLGFSPAFVFKILSFLFLSGKVGICDVAEMNPEFDRDGSTAGLAARVVDWVVGNMMRGK